MLIELGVGPYPLVGPLRAWTLMWVGTLDVFFVSFINRLQAGRG